MEFNEDILLRYMSMAPLALAFERYLECQILKNMSFPAPVLDLGCGEGLFAHILFATPIDTGIDPNPHELARARQLGAYSELLQCSGDSIPRPDGYYKTIFSNSVLEHIPDLGPVFKEIHRLLAPNGRFYMTVPSPQFEHMTIINQLLTAVGLSQLAARYRQFCSETLWRQCHYHTLEEWGNLVSSFGFVIETSFTYDPPAICLLNDFLYPFSIFDVINKKLFNRWVLFPALRRVVLYPLYLLVRGVLNGGVRADSGGLVFLSLVRKDG